MPASRQPFLAERTVRGEPSAWKTHGGCGLGTWAKTNCGPSPIHDGAVAKRIEDAVDPVALLLR